MIKSDIAQELVNHKGFSLEKAEQLVRDVSRISEESNKLLVIDDFLYSFCDQDINLRELKKTK